MFMESSIIIWLQSFESDFLDYFFITVSHISSWVGAIVLFIFITLVLDKRFGIYWLVTFIFGLIINYYIKIIVSRPRPFEVFFEIKNKLPTIGYSFPSGHAYSCTFMFFVILLLIEFFYKSNAQRRNKLLMYFAFIFGIFWILLTALSRMYLGQHYISDIFGGIVVASISFFISNLVYHKHFASKNNYQKD